MTTLPTPQRLDRNDESQLIIEWDDGIRQVLSFRMLRDHCPCATCREKKTAAPPPQGTLPILTPSEARPLEIVSMRPVGNYAYNIEFSDGHNSGIYSFEFLRALEQASP